MSLSSAVYCEVRAVLVVQFSMFELCSMFIVIYERTNYVLFSHTVSVSVSVSLCLSVSVCLSVCLSLSLPLFLSVSIVL